MFVILKYAYSVDILYIIHVTIDAIFFVTIDAIFFVFFNMHAPFVIIFLRYIIYNWESQDDGVQPCDCPTI